MQCFLVEMYNPSLLPTVPATHLSVIITPKGTHACAYAHQLADQIKAELKTPPWEFLQQDPKEVSVPAGL